MGVYLPNMEMPKNCICCDLSHEDGWCPAKQDYIDRYSFETCPLAPVPPHGRLGDLDALFKQVTMDEHFSVLEAMYVQSLISNAPTIIPAEPCNNLSKPFKEEGE